MRRGRLSVITAVAYYGQLMPSIVHLITQWQLAGYRVKLIFLQLDHPEEAIARVALRVKQGGHDISEAVIRRRFDSGLNNFEQLYSHQVDAWALYDNSGERPLLLRWKDKHEQ